MKKEIMIISMLFLVPILVVLVFNNEKDKELEGISEVVDTSIRVMMEDNSIEEVPLEEYLVGVLAMEMPISFHLEAMKAQAVASRSYVLYQKSKTNKEYDVVNTTNNQVYQTEEMLRSLWGDKYEERINKVREAVFSTEGIVMTYNDEIINALFFSTAPEYTENSEDVFSSKLPYLRSVESSWDRDAPNYMVNKTFTFDELSKKLGLSKIDSFVVNEKSETGRVKSVLINGKLFEANKLRTLLGLRSTYFNYLIKDYSITFITYGYGHGVGMSQYGANFMAKEGYSYEDILNHYYSDISFQKNV